MGKIKSFHSLKLSLMIYIPICVIAAVIGTLFIGHCTNELQGWYSQKNLEMHNVYIHQNDRVQYITSDGEPVTADNNKYLITYWIISYAQVFLMPLWIFGCVAVTGIIFYNTELKKPINILLDASHKISDNQLDFKVEYNKQNELGILCTAFDEMRSALYKSNREMWRSLEERKRLNSAFSHDLRTPLTVLKGYADFLEKYIPDGRVSEEKLISVISMMNGQISRLEHYTQKMNAVQKLEDIMPDYTRISTEALFTMLSETGKIICGDQFKINTTPDSRTISIDTDLVIQVYENLISNAVRYTENSVEVSCSITGNMLMISVMDNGRGFTEEALKKAVLPFFRDEKEPDKLHFGLGLYICRILCEKCGGDLTVENHENGGKVTAGFFCGEKYEGNL